MWLAAERSHEPDQTRGKGCNIAVRLRVFPDTNAERLLPSASQRQRDCHRNRCFIRGHGQSTSLGRRLRWHWSVLGLGVVLPVASSISSLRVSTSCWSDVFASLRDECCDTAKYGRRGNPACWDEVFHFERCCGKRSGSPNETDDSENSPLLLEDAIEAANAETAFDETLAVRVGMAGSSNISRAEVAASGRVRFDFEALSRQPRGGPEADVRIFVHSVPPCAGESLLRDFLDAGDELKGDAWRDFVFQQAQHLHALHDAVMRSGALVKDSRDATVFYVPAFWSLVVEAMLMLSSLRDPHTGLIVAPKAGGSMTLVDKVLDNVFATGVSPTACLTMTFDALRQSDVYMRNAAYDHFWVAGIQNPLNIIPALAARFENYDPFAKNMMFLAAGVREHGWSDFLFEWHTPQYSNLHKIFVPYSTTVHCRLLEALAHSPRPRPLAVVFAGSCTSRVRHWAREVARDVASDRRIVLRFADVEKVRAESLRGSEGGNGSARLALTTNYTALYRSADFCLVLPGHLHDLTKRCYDAMAQGCLPVIITKPRFWMALPFAARHGRGSWTSFADFRRAGSKAAFRQIIDELVIRHEHDQEGIRRQRLALSSAPGLFASHDPVGCTAAERAAFPANIIEELRARQEVWPHIRSSWLFDEEEGSEVEDLLG
eukprot:TRINITY_DN67699_c0_g1_i1.p1 TRINITY_DN67699_c0_g1~~TRINITY_DN67699_c0_g1_i1.p1  ORF type:complete len:659 (+),score=101.89 TRINITY_DN67699_c0_g1_i1:114-2090(+)